MLIRRTDQREDRDAGAERPRLHEPRRELVQAERDEDSEEGQIWLPEPERVDRGDRLADIQRKERPERVAEDVAEVQNRLVRRVVEPG